MANVVYYIKNELLLTNVLFIKANNFCPATKYARSLYA